VRWDLHTHYYPDAFFRLIEQVGGAFSFGTDPTEDERDEESEARPNS
jgi:hypothetical protein